MTENTMIRPHGLQCHHSPAAATQRGHHNRKWRQRYRRHEAVAEAIAGPYVEKARGGGRLQACDLRLVRRAIRERWPTDPDIRDSILSAADQLLEPGANAGDCPDDDRLTIAVARTLVEAATITEGTR